MIPAAVRWRQPKTWFINFLIINKVKVKENLEQSSLVKVLCICSLWAPQIRTRFKLAWLLTSESQIPTA